MQTQDYLKFFINFLSTIFLDSTADSLFSLLDEALLIIGLWGILKKGGLKGWWALVPCVKYVKVGQVAGREKEGRMAGFAVFAKVIFLLAEQIIEFYIVTHMPANAEALYRITGFLDIAALVATIVQLIQIIRIYLGLIEVYGQSKWWIVPWIIVEGLTAILWGWMKKFQPQWTAREMKTDASVFFSNSKAAVLEQGLTVNLEERTATEFFKKKYLLRDIHMYIQPGHMVLLLGGSGAGKTTYLNAVNGYEKAKAEVVLNGQNMYKNYKEMQYDIGFVPQMDLMRGSDSVFRTLLDAATLRLPEGLSKADHLARVEEVMKIFGLTPVKNNLVSKLSGGQRKRLSIAMEFISNPSLFILDEPDSGLDGVMARELFMQLRKIADQGKIIIVITHTPDRVIDLFDDVIVLAKDANRTGRLAYFGPIPQAREFFGKEKMEEIVKSINREEEGGEGRADEFILKFAEVQHG